MHSQRSHVWELKSMLLHWHLRVQAAAGRESRSGSWPVTWDDGQSLICGSQQGAIVVEIVANNQADLKCEYQYLVQEGNTKLQAPYLVHIAL